MAAFCFTCNASPLLEIALVLVRFDHIAGLMLNVNHNLCEGLKETDSGWL